MRPVTRAICLSGLALAAGLAGCLREVRPETRLTLTVARGSAVVTREVSLAELEAYGVEPVATSRPFGAAKVQGVMIQRLLDSEGVPPEANYVVFHCADGYAAYVPAGFFKRYPAALATRVDGRPPERFPRAGGKPVGLFLALPNAAYPELDSPRLDEYWATEIIGVETARLYNRVAPAAAALRPGQELFVQQCIHCHSVNGAGGLKGPELAGVSKRRGRDAFVAYARNPSSQNTETDMPAFSPTLSDAELGSIYDYLAALPR